MKLVAFDLENTLIFNEFLPELASLLGREDEVAEITRAGIDGRIDWEDGFRRRAALLRGLTQAQVLRAARHLRPVPGAQEFVHWLRGQGSKVAIVTGGPREVAEAAMVLFEADAIFSNEFVFEAGSFTGDVRVHVSPGLKGDIVRGLAARWGIGKEDILAFGDGLMDAPLLAEAAVRIGINSNGKLRDHVDFEPRDYVDAREWLVEKGALHGTKGDKKD
ncbi:MAG TPA: HAD family phosphatase [Thermoplasmata archaeon]|nr:HAD family phosphatase [Thermoplasmata archaeon]